MSESRDTFPTMSACGCCWNSSERLQMGAKRPFAIAYVSYMPHSQLHLGVGMHPWHPEEQSCSAELRRTTCGATQIGGNPRILKLEGGTHLHPPCKITPWWNFITQAGLLANIAKVSTPPLGTCQMNSP